MKKITSAILCFLFAIAVNAQSSLEIREHGTSNVVNGATYNFWIAANSSTHTIEFDAFNISNATIDYKITKTNVTIDAGASSWFCVFHNGDATDIQSHCYLPVVTTTAHSFNTNPGEFNGISADFSPGANNAVSIVRYKIYDMNNIADSAIFTLVYNVSPAGISSVFAPDFAVGNAYPNPSSGTFNFTVGATNNPVNYTIFNLNGELVKSENVFVHSGTISIDLSGLPNAVYTCRFSSGELISAEQRLVIAN